MCDFVDRAIARGTPQEGGSVEIACLIKDHAANGFLAVCSLAKRVHDFLWASGFAGSNLKSNPEISTAFSSSIQRAVVARQSTEPRPVPVEFGTLARHN